MFILLLLISRVNLDKIRINNYFNRKPSLPITQLKFIVLMFILKCNIDSGKSGDRNTFIHYHIFMFSSSFSYPFPTKWGRYMLSSYCDKDSAIIYVLCIIIYHPSHMFYFYKIQTYHSRFIPEGS
jgi:hypothetical protein